MKKNELNIESLKEILESTHNPDELDSHPWTKSLFVRDIVENHENLQDQSSGRQLLLSIAELFRQMMPASPPKHGVRLDSRWSKFAFLAAKYFAPVLFGQLVPVSFQEAWERMDESILLFVYGEKGAEEFNEGSNLYMLIGNEPESTPISTLSDWHRKGLESLIEIIQAREEYLALSLADNSERIERESIKKKKRKRISGVLFAILFIGILVTGGRKVFRIYEKGMPVYQDIIQLKGIATSSPKLDSLKEAGPILKTLQGDLNIFREEADPLLWIAPYLGWVPKYGCELASSRAVLDFATSLTDLGVEGYQASLPFLQIYESDTAKLDLPVITELLVQAQPQFSKAQNFLKVAQGAREDINDACLSPDVHDLLINKIDPLLILADDGLTLALELPRVLGATNEGPKTYLLLVLNEDELRPTGGFITAAGTILLENGQIGGMKFENSGDLDNWEKPYPIAPWQFREYMNSPVLVFRDANWFTDFPTSALYAEYLYSYARNHSVDGVVAFNQQMLVEVLDTLGPIKLENVSYLIDSTNVIPYMRSEKTRHTEDDFSNQDWSNKDFINDISEALLTKIFAGDIQWEKLVNLLLRTLDEHYLLLQLDNPAMTSLLARYGWDGSLRPGDGDFLMVVDSNIGFNKTNAVVETSIVYDVDLTNLATPISNLTVFHKNNSDSKIPCVQWHGVTLEGQKDYPIDRCYWDYMRVYMPAGTELLDANPQSIPADWMILRQAVPSRVDVLDEDIPGVQGFGVLKVVPGGDTIATNFEFNLPIEIIKKQSNSDIFVYKLRIQKQPGTIGVPIVLRVHFANNVTIYTAPSGAEIQESNVFWETDLREDREFEITFQLP